MSRFTLYGCLALAISTTSCTSSDPEPPSAVLTYEDLRKTPFDPESKDGPAYPAAIAKLDGQRIRISGFMTPFDRLDDMRRFKLMPFPTGCRFCRAPSPVEVLLVRFPKSDEKQSYRSGALEVTGTLRLWSSETKDPLHVEYPFIVENASVREYREEEDRPEELIETHPPGRPVGGDEDEDF
ncbi:MAG: DUF3299 domain-containing protein [Planctomycetota bacterium]